MRLDEFFPRESILTEGDFDVLALSNSKTKGRILSFLDDIRYLKEFNENKNIVAVICKPEMRELLADHVKGIVISENPRKAYFELHNRLSQRPEYCRPQSKSVIGENCRISPMALIDSDGVFIEDNVEIQEFVSIKGPCHIGANTVIRAGAIIGGGGFEFKRYPECVLDVVHCGSVDIGSNVIIWENTTIHKAVYPWDATVIGDFVRIGANCHIDHGAKIGSLSEVCSGAIISGRTVLEKGAFVGPGSVLSNRLRLGEYSRSLIGSVVTKDVDDHQTVSGNFAVDHSHHMVAVKRDAEG